MSGAGEASASLNLVCGRVAVKASRLQERRSHESAGERDYWRLQSRDSCPCGGVEFLFDHLGRTVGRVIVYSQNLDYEFSWIRGEPTEGTRATSRKY